MMIQLHISIQEIPTIGDFSENMSTKEELYAALAEKIARLNEELIIFTKQAEATQKVIANASEVTTIYSDLYTNK